MYLPVLTVHWPVPVSDPPEVLASPTQLHATVGWTVSLCCLVWADPPATVSWYRGTSDRELLETQDQPSEKVTTEENLFLRKELFWKLQRSVSVWIIFVCRVVKEQECSAWASCRAPGRRSPTTAARPGTGGARPGPPSSSQAVLLHQPYPRENSQTAGPGN